MTLVEITAGDASVGVDAAVTQEGPVAASVFKEFGVDLGDEDLFPVVGGLGDDPAEGVGDEGAAPEFQAGVGRVRAGALHQRAVVLDVAVLVADTVNGTDEDAVGDGVGALHGLPGGVLGFAELFLFRRMPADGGWVKEGFRTHEGGDAGSLGIPLVPADEGSDGPVRGALGAEPEIAGGEIKLFVIERVVGDVHLAVDAGEVVRCGAGVVEDGGSVVVETGGAALEQGSYQYDFFIFDDLAEDGGGGSGDGLGGVEESVLFALAEVLGAEELREADDIGTGAGGLADEFGCLVEVVESVYAAGHLNEGDFFVRRLLLR